MAFIHLPKMAEYVLQVDGYVRRIILTKSNIESSSLKIPLNAAIDLVTVTINETQLLYSDVRSINVNAPDITLRANTVLLENGEGLFLKLKINSQFTLTSTNKIKIQINLENGSHIYQTADELTITPLNELYIFMKTPTVQADDAIFEEAYLYGDLGWRTGAYGQNLLVYDGASFKIAMADTFMLLRNPMISDNWTLTPSLVVYNELSTLPIAVFWSVLLFPILTFLVITIRIKKKD
jgi:hypothetical protein